MIFINVTTLNDQTPRSDLYKMAIEWNSQPNFRQQCQVVQKKALLILYIDHGECHHYSTTYPEKVSVVFKSLLLDTIQN